MHEHNKEQRKEYSRSKRRKSVSRDNR